VIKGQSTTELEQVDRLRAMFADMLRPQQKRKRKRVISTDSTDQELSIEGCRGAAEESGISAPDFDDSLLRFSPPTPRSQKTPDPILTREGGSSSNQAFVDLFLKAQKKTQELVNTLNNKRSELNATQELIQRSAERREKLQQLVTYYERPIALEKPDMGEPGSWGHFGQTGGLAPWQLVANTEVSHQLSLEAARNSLEVEGKTLANLERESAKLTMEISQLQGEGREAAAPLQAIQQLMSSILS